MGKSSRTTKSSKRCLEKLKNWKIYLYNNNGNHTTDDQKEKEHDAFICCHLKNILRLQISNKNKYGIRN